MGSEVSVAGLADATAGGGRERWSQGDPAGRRGRASRCERDHFPDRETGVKDR
jgi:hypothetical protein